MKPSLSLPAGITLRVALSRLLLWVERAVPAFLPAGLVAAGFLTLSVYGLWGFLPGWLHLLLLLIFALSFLMAVVRGAAGLHYPTAVEGIRRLERTNHAPHRPVTTLVDPPAAVIASARRAWAMHLERSLQAARRLRLRRPRNLFTRADPLALRVGLGILLTVGLAAFGSETAARVAGAFQPDLSRASAPPGTLTAWVAPPGYTALPPIALDAGGADTSPGAPVSVPGGSVLLARVHGGSGESAIEMADSAPLSFVQLDAANAALEVPVQAAGPVRVRQGSEVLAHWVFEIRDDQAPAVRFVEPPHGTARGTLVLNVAAEDDYGVQALQAVVQRVGAGPQSADRDPPVHLQLPASSRRARTVEHVTYHDLAAHVWAGEPVHVELVGTDALGQAGRISVDTVLPERRFNHPVAAAIVAERKQYALQRAPVREIARNLQALAAAGEAYDEAVRARDAIVEAASLISDPPERTARQQAIDRLWEAAVWIEDGSFAEAEAGFRDAQERLADALRQERRPEALEQMLSDIQSEMQDLLEELDDLPPPGPEDDTAASVPGGMDADPNAVQRELQDKVDEVVELATTGAPEEAEDALEELREITENMDRAGERMLRESDQRLDQRQAMMQQMQEMMQEQEQMMEESFYQSARAGAADQKSPGSGNFDPPDERQNELREELGDVMRQIGEEGEAIPSELGEAEQAMRQAAEELQRGRPEQASDAQGRALDALRLGYERVRPMPGGRGPSQVAGERPSPNRQQATDPLGRVPPGDGASVTGDIGIPTRPERRRAREIVEELRSRAGDSSRPELDRDYATRLLDWY